MNKSSFWWKDVISLGDIFKGIAQSTVRTWTLVFFWEDLWNEKLRCNKFPILYIVGSDKLEFVKQICSKPLEDAFLLPLNADTYEEFLILQSELEQIHLQAGYGDHWNFIWNVDKFSTQRLYKLFFFFPTTTKAICLDLEDKMRDENKSICLAFIDGPI